MALNDVYWRESFISIIDLVIEIRNNQIKQLKIGIVFQLIFNPNKIFGNFSLLTKISIPSSVNKIGEDSFFGIKSLEITENIQIILDKKFYMYFIKANHNSYFCNSNWKNAFSHCSSLIQITIPSFVIQIEDYAFAYCSSLKQITIPFSVTQIGNSAFHHC